MDACGPQELRTDEAHSYLAKKGQQVGAKHETSGSLWSSAHRRALYERAKKSRKHAAGELGASLGGEGALVGSAALNSKATAQRTIRSRVAILDSGVEASGCGGVEETFAMPTDTDFDE